MRTGVFVCHCGINIGGVVDVPAVRDYAATLPTVVYSADNLFTCSQDTAVKMAEVIKEKNLTRVVVASCSPRTHEGLFQENCEKAGLNKYLFEMANIRDQNSWVHMHEPEAATEKSKRSAAHGRSQSSIFETFETGTAIRQSSGFNYRRRFGRHDSGSSLADQGFASFIVEKEERLGGNYNHLYKTLEGLDARAHLKGLLEKVYKNPLITVATGAKIDKIEGFIGNYKTTVKVKEGEKFSSTV